MSSLHDEYVVISADKGFNVIIFVYKDSLNEVLTTEMTVTLIFGNSTCTNEDFDKAKKKPGKSSDIHVLNERSDERRNLWFVVIIVLQYCSIDIKQWPIEKSPKKIQTNVCDSSKRSTKECAVNMTRIVLPYNIR